MTLTRLGPLLAGCTLVVAGPLLGCGGGGAGRPRYGDRGLIASHNQFMLAFGGARRERIASPAWRVENFNGTSPRGDAEYRHSHSYDFPARETSEHSTNDDTIDFVEEIDTFELRLRHTEAEAQMWVRSIPLSRAQQSEMLTSMQGAFIERASGPSGWLVDLNAAPTTPRFAITPLAEGSCEVDSVGAQEFIYEARLEEQGTARIVHVVLLQSLSPWVPTGRPDVPANRLRSLVMLGFAASPDAYSTLAPEFTDLVSRVRMADPQGRPRPQETTTCANLRASIATSRLRVGDVIVYRYAGTAIGPEAIELRQEVTDQDRDHLTLEVTMRQSGQILRRWAEERIDAPANWAADQIESLCIFEGQSCHEMPIEAITELRAGLHATFDSAPINLSESEETRTVSGRDIACTVRRGTVSVGGQNMHFEEASCPELPWPRASAAFVSEATGDVVLAVGVLEVRRPH